MHNYRGVADNMFPFSSLFEESSNDAANRCSPHLIRDRLKFMGRSAPLLYGFPDRRFPLWQ